MTTKTDILIIGGGIIGACTALSLTRAGRQVTLVERGDICAGASHGNACWVAAGYAIPTAAPGVIKQGLRWMFDASSPFSIKPRLNLDLLKWLWAFRGACNEEQMLAGAEVLLQLNQQSLEMFRDLAADPTLEFDYVEDGLLHLHLSDAYRQAGEAEAALLNSLGVTAKVLDREGILELEPKLQEGVNSGVFFPDHARVNPNQLVNVVMARAALESTAGTTIQTHTTVTGFEKQGNYIQKVKTDKGDFEANEVILAAGAWSSILAKQLGAPILMEPAKGYSVTAKRNSPEQGPSRSIAIDDSKVAITPLGSDRYRFSSTLELAGFDLSLNQKRLDVNLETLKTVLPDMQEIDVEETWSGYRPLTPDGLPLIGRSERIDNLIFATGHGMLGITHGPITGKLVTEILSEQEPSIDLASMKPERF